MKVFVRLFLLILGLLLSNNLFAEEISSAQNKVVEKKDFSLKVDSSFKASDYVGLPLIIDFGSKTCPPCVRMHPDLKTVNEATKGKAYVKYVDVQMKNPPINDMPIRVTPTQVFFNADGTPYIPSKALGNVRFRIVTGEDGSHLYTMHEGMMNSMQMMRILQEMGMK